MRSLSLRTATVLLTLVWATAIAASGSFRFAPQGDTSLALYEGSRPVFVYHHGVIRSPDAPADRARSSYLHPVYGLDGEVLTDDFPKDHYHHRGLFWAWPHVEIGGKHYDLWMLTGIRHQFVRWQQQQTTPNEANLGIENGWFVGDRQVMREQVRIQVRPASDTGRAIDFEFTWTPMEQALTLRGAEDKSYGGPTLRYAPRKNTVITTLLGQGTNDLTVTRLPWADLSASFAGAPQPSGIALLVAPDHPDYPPTWLTRHYGALCLGWPGVNSKTFPPGEPFHCRYRVWVHRGMPTVAELAAVYVQYTNALTAALLSPLREASATRTGAGLPLRAESHPDRVSVFVGSSLFTEYCFGEDLKYPQFFPVNGPRSGRSVTTRRTEPYPHHSSLFLGCDRVNGGNYWQEGLDRGRIVSRDLRLTEAAGERIVIEQQCRWERPGAESPFTDRRRIVITAPGADRRQIDFAITLNAEIDVRIEKNNHSLFAARMAPDLAVNGGGTLQNSRGQLGEKGTLGNPADWMDARGRRGDFSEGLAIFCHPRDAWSPCPWFTRDYGFFSPTPMNWLSEHPFELAQGKTLHLRYRVIVHADDPTPGQLQREFERWTTLANP